VEVLNARLVPPFGERLRLSIDRDGIEALQEDRGKLWARVQGADWLTLNEKRRATGYDDVAGGDVLLVSPAMAPLESLSPAGSAPAPGKVAPAPASVLPPSSAPPPRTPRPRQRNEFGLLTSDAADLHR
jgi:hypothetical protein